ncbi:VIT1/CCC1 transporter family protein [Candidatus Kinetoplastidibacterium crithidiae]|uniref:Nodulin 21-like protein n=1 Tax=Candidatus Kinetoplastidibacterium crithidiae TCC036E TaxID=1208918 RepID=M1LU46_9PROT|nr:VIT family protein [Candidatus Kinetoplastibacterium crithidii]AFZ82722.1 membrane protein [Candidatus Kinetoplastibacterium crithidii (ex Angomonas deanei ATCC 30255)]AGF47626.1 nodulin 21-like protein [Candidatus Kinetoplastibacterium crithidii TCC036E]
MPAKEHHKIFRSAWLRASVLGANDGIISTSSLITGIASTSYDYFTIISAGIVGLIAGSLSMAVGEYVSVQSQADIENADLQMEQYSLKKNHEEELEELISIYVDRGVSYDLATQVASQLTDHNALDAHARDELGILIHNRARPLQAALASSISFALGSILPIMISIIVPVWCLIPSIIVGSVICLAILGAVSAITGGAKIWPAIRRISILGAISMIIASFSGSVFEFIL